jgi:hypothetical protein
LLGWLLPWWLVRRRLLNTLWLALLLTTGLVLLLTTLLLWLVARL